MITVTESNFKEEVEEVSGLTVIDLYADWCMPCKMLAPVLEELEQEFPNVRFAKINVDFSPELAAMFHVESIPMVAFVNNGTFIDLSVGLVPKERLRELIELNSSFEF